MIQEGCNAFNPWDQRDPLSSDCNCCNTWSECSVVPSILGVENSKFGFINTHSSSLSVSFIGSYKNQWRERQRSPVHTEGTRNGEHSREYSSVAACTDSTTESSRQWYFQPTQIFYHIRKWRRYVVVQDFLTVWRFSFSSEEWNRFDRRKSMLKNRCFAFLAWFLS